jgi:hypothetical protein
MFKEIIGTIKGPVILLSMVGFVLGLLTGLGIHLYYLAPLAVVALYLFWVIGCLLYMKFFDRNI